MELPEARDRQSCDIELDAQDHAVCTCVGMGCLRFLQMIAFCDLCVMCMLAVDCLFAVCISYFVCGVVFLMRNPTSLRVEACKLRIPPHENKSGVADLQQKNCIN